MCVIDFCFARDLCSAFVCSCNWYIDPMLPGEFVSPTLLPFKLYILWNKACVEVHCFLHWPFLIRFDVSLCHCFRLSVCLSLCFDITIFRSLEWVANFHRVQYYLLLRIPHYLFSSSSALIVLKLRRVNWADTSAHERKCIEYFVLKTWKGVTWYSEAYEGVS